MMCLNEGHDPVKEMVENLFENIIEQMNPGPGKLEESFNQDIAAINALAVAGEIEDAVYKLSRSYLGLLRIREADLDPAGIIPRLFCDL